MKALFIYYENALESKGRMGGVQICTQEFVKVLRAAGFDLVFFQVRNDMRILNRVRRKLFGTPYRYAFCTDEVIESIRNFPHLKDIRYVFLNQAILRPLGKALRKILEKDIPIILLSHGLLSVDLLHALEVNANGSLPIWAEFTKLRLAKTLIDEGRHAPYLDYVFCLSPIEEALERWRGARHVRWLPRIIQGSSLLWQPTFGRIGYVGTLDHPPNYESLLLLLEALKERALDSIEVRIVGGPENVGRSLTRRYPFAKYLGRLPDRALRKEASTWNCVVHPLFRWSMGASMKLSIFIGWEIPIVTTSAGCRGYIWRDGNMPIADDPVLFADLVIRMTYSGYAHQMREEVSKIKASSPSIDKMARIVRQTLNLNDL